MLKKVRLWNGMTALFAFLLSVVMFISPLANLYAGSVNEFLGIKAPTTQGSVDGSNYIYKTSYTEDGIPSDEGLVKLLEAADAFIAREQEEGSVLLKNENNALPLTAEERSVTLFGRATADPLYRSKTGGPEVSGERLVSLKDALEAEGFRINETLFNAYAESDNKRTKYGNDGASANGSTQPSSIGEESRSFYTAELQNSYANDYNDVAIVMFTREAGEGTDMTYDAQNELDGVPTLTLHQSEADLLKMIQESGKFEKTIVLINSGNAMDLGWLDKEEYGVDACLWIGGPGLRGFVGVANILVGKANPSGRLVDTYATSQFSAPAMENFGSFLWTNKTETSAVRSEMYLVEAEGIYVGYKYYESRYYDAVMGQYNASSAVGRTETLSEGGADISIYPEDITGWDYAIEMVYPFGYGLSYSKFNQSIVADSFRYDPESDTFTIDVLVEHVEGPAGKSVVELYVQQPYTQYDRDHLVEKSAIQLVGFGKTKMLSAEDPTDVVTITVDRYLIASYDANEAKGYILDEGNYYFAIGDDVHDALNNIIAKQVAEGSVTPVLELTDAAGNTVEGNAEKVAVYTLDAFDKDSYRYSRYGDNIEVTNVFDGEYSIDVNAFLPDSEKITYLTRGGGGNDWSTSYPEPVIIAASDEMMSILEKDRYEAPSDAPDISSFNTSVDSGIHFVDMQGVALDDERWETFLDQLSITNLLEAVKDSWGEKPVASVKKPANQNGDGPDGAQFAYIYGDKSNCTSYVNEVVAASSWNIDLIRELGDFIAEDCLYSGTQGLWSPGANLHRTAYSGRNFEYYSEDSIMSYLYIAAECAAMQAKGMMATPKHFAGNDQETNRVGVATFMTEQRYRQECLRGFEGAYTVGGAMSTMTAMNRIGLIPMPANDRVQINILREEWGFDGVIITDALPWMQYAKTLDCLLGGSNIFCLGDRSGDIRPLLRSDGYMMQIVRESNKYFYYALLQTNIVNGLTRDVVVEDFTPWWEIALVALEVAFGALTVVSFGLTVTAFVLDRKKKDKEAV